MAEDSNTLHIEYKDENKPIPNVIFRMYRVADQQNVSVNGYVYVDQFENCPITINNQMSHSAWVEAAEDLKDYISQKGIRAQYTDRTDSKGRIDLYSIPSGLYLVDGDDITINDITYTPQVFCTLVTPKNTEAVTPKFSQESITKPGSGSSSGGGGGGGKGTTVASKQDPPDEDSTSTPGSEDLEGSDNPGDNSEDPDSPKDPDNPSDSSGGGSGGGSGSSGNDLTDTSNFEYGAGSTNASDSSERRFKYGDLVITKTVSGDSGDKNADWHFNLTVNPSVNGVYGDVTFVDGVAEFTLKHGESVIVTDLPEGTTYSVTELEADSDGYTSSWVDAEGKISNTAIARAEFLNVRNGDPADNLTSDTEHVPQTGDPSNMNLWFITMLVSLILLLGVLVYSLLRKNK